MAKKEIKWTKQQQDAINTMGKNILVTASAGTGKTAVLSGRCAKIVSDKNLCDKIWNVLVLTFTEAAAEQMKSRIDRQLRDEYQKNTNEHVKRQLLLLQGADISTIHSFCKRIITEYFYTLGLDPTFKIIDADEQKLIKLEVLEKTIEWAWSQKNFCKGFEELLTKRNLNTDGFLENIIGISEYLDSLPFRESWHEKVLSRSNQSDVTIGEHAKKQIETIKSELTDALAGFSHIRKIHQFCGGKNSQRLYEKQSELISDLIKLLDKDFNNFITVLKDVKKPACSTPKDVDETLQKFIQAKAKHTIDILDDIKNLAVANPQYSDIVCKIPNLQAKTLVELVKKFDELYRNAKKNLNCLDFSDLEHKAMELLMDKNSSENNIVPSQTAMELRNKYKYIFVDEYQDINPIQKVILDLLSNKGNVFVVGDIKQSIYAFRGAEPKIFLKELNNASENRTSDADGFRVDLNENFRSTKSILDFVNNIFAQIMTKQIAGLDYDQRAALKSSDNNNASKKVELCLLETDEKENTEENNEDADESKSSRFSDRQKQAAFIAKRIRQLVGTDSGKAEFQIFDSQTNQQRDVQYSDIVILLRSPAERVNDYVEILRMAGIPVSSQTGSGYFDACEIRDMLCLLKLLDNMNRDIELAAVLRSPIFNVTDSELAEIKLSAKDTQEIPDSDGEVNIKGRGSFHFLFSNYIKAGKNKNLAAKLQNISNKLQDWRTKARRGVIAELIWQIYRQSGYLSFVTGLPNGMVRKANLLKLHEKAIQFEGFISSGTCASLPRFIEFIEKIQEGGQKWAEAMPENETENAVRIISVHKSKGLEFPVVILAELNSRMGDKKNDVIINSDGLGLKAIDKKNNCKTSSLAYQVIEEEKNRTNIAEEMRILYVALTRAKEKLIVTANCNLDKCKNMVLSGLCFENKIADWELKKCGSHIEWILYGLSGSKPLHDALKVPAAANIKDADFFQVQMLDQNQLIKLEEYIDKLRNFEKDKTVIPANTAKKTPLYINIKNNLSWKYRHSDIVDIAAKASVSQLTHLDDEFAQIDYTQTLNRKPHAAASDAEIKIDYQTLGTAVHLLLSKIDLNKPIDAASICKLKKHLVETAIISQNIADKIDERTILKFFESELGQKTLNPNNKIWRELPFTFSISVDNYLKMKNKPPAGNIAGNEIIVVQGIIDLLIEEKDNLILIDFKTDRISQTQAADKAMVYKAQINLYAMAAETIFKKKTAQKCLYFITSGFAITI